MEQQIDVIVNSLTNRYQIVENIDSTLQQNLIEKARQVIKNNNVGTRLVVLDARELQKDYNVFKKFAIYNPNIKEYFSKKESFKNPEYKPTTSEAIQFKSGQFLYKYFNIMHLTNYLYLNMVQQAGFRSDYINIVEIEKQIEFYKEGNLDAFSASDFKFVDFGDIKSIIGGYKNPKYQRPFTVFIIENGEKITDPYLQQIINHPFFDNRGGYMSMLLLNSGRLLSYTDTDNNLVERLHDADYFNFAPQQEKEL
ncbi:MAG: hypothetical protein AB7S44_02015 [Spirochaetales bacterium]